MTQKKAIFVCSQKGGTGKSTFSRVLLDHMRGRGDIVAAFDTDAKVGQLAQFYAIKDAAGNIDTPANLADWKSGVTSFDIRDQNQVVVMADALDLGADNLLFDMPGGSIDDMKAVFGSMDRFLKEYEAEGYQTHVFLVITPMLASSRNIHEVIQAFGPNAKYTVVKNLAFGNEADFPFFDGELADRAGNPSDVLDKVKGSLIAFPRLEVDTYAKVDADSVKFSVAADPSHGYSRTDRTRIAYFMKDAGTVIDTTGI